MACNKAGCKENLWLRIVIFVMILITLMIAVTAFFVSYDKAKNYNNTPQTICIVTANLVATRTCDYQTLNAYICSCNENMYCQYCRYTCYDGYAVVMINDIIQDKLFKVVDVLSTYSDTLSFLNKTTPIGHKFKCYYVDEDGNSSIQVYLRKKDANGLYIASILLSVITGSILLLWLTIECIVYSIPGTIRDKCIGCCKNKRQLY